MAMIYCFECGKKVSSTAEKCPHCGARLKNDNRALVAFVLAFFLGVFGLHRFYVGRTTSGFVMLFISLTMFGLFITGVWALIDMIMIVCGTFEDANGKKISF